MTDVTWQETLRGQGYRLTPQRQMVLEAVQQLSHATPDDILQHVQHRSSGVNASTVYRTLDLLEKTGLVRHTHLGHGAPTYHPSTAPSHIHLVCRNCHGVDEVDPDMAASLAAGLQSGKGFEIDVSHLTIYGICASCGANES